MYNRKLIEYIPPFLRNVREYNVILEDAEQPEITLMWQSLNNGLNDQFVVDATENGVSRWENILGIVPKATLTLDERKFTILTKINEQLPFTITTLKEQLETLCGKNGYSLILNNEKFTLDVKVALIAKNNLTDVDELLKRVVPANLIVTLTLKYNKHEAFNGYTHEQMKAFSHYTLRNEVLN